MWQDAPPAKRRALQRSSGLRMARLRLRRRQKLFCLVAPVPTRAIGSALQLARQRYRRGDQAVGVNI